MEERKGKNKVSCWRNVEEFKLVKNLLFKDNASLEDKKEALKAMQKWKIRRSQDTPLGVLCTLILLDVKLKEEDGIVKDKAALSSLYGSAITKFINYASSFNSYRGSMYGTAQNLGIDSFLIDLRHNFAHGKQTPSLEVFRQSHSLCMNWIQDYYWEKEEENLADVEIRDIRIDSELDTKLDQIFQFYDLLADLIHKGIKNFDELEASNEQSKGRWPLVKQFMKEKKFANFRVAFKFFTSQLAVIIESRSLRSNPETFFYALVTKCDYFMSASQNRDKLTDVTNENGDEEDEEVLITPVKKKRKNQQQSIVNIYQDLIWNIARNDYFKILLDTLFQIYLNRGEEQARRQSAKFWILILLKSYHYYVKYCQYQKASVAEERRITEEVRKIYMYQLNVDLTNVFILVGSQMLTNSLKYSKDFLLNLIQHASKDENDFEICYSIMPFVSPSLSSEQVKELKNLMEIISSPNRKRGEKSSTEIFTLGDLQSNVKSPSKDNIWEICDDDVDWSSLAIGYDFKM